MRFYTGRGDDGTTDLLGARVTKDDPRIEALGSLDEASSAIGMGRAMATAPGLDDVLTESQRDLYRIMSELAFTAELRPELYRLGDDRIVWLEGETDRLAGGVNLPREFVLPGESPGGAALDVARTTVRRAERQLVVLARTDYEMNPTILGYMNRLSSLLFLAARVEERAAGAGPKRAKAR